VAIGSPAVIRVGGDVVIAGTLGVDVDQALIDSSEGDVYVTGAVLGSLANVTATAANATFALVSERGFARVSGTLTSLGLLKPPGVGTQRVVPGGSILIGAKSAYLLGAHVDASGANAPSGGSAGVLGIIYTPTAFVGSLILTSGQVPGTDRLTTALFGTLRSSGGAAAGSADGGLGRRDDRRLGRLHARHEHHGERRLDAG